METVTTGDESAGPIEYARAEQPLRRRLRRWRAPIVLALVAVSAYFWWPPLWLRAQIFYWQFRIAGHESPADAVAALDPFGRSDYGPIPGGRPATQPGLSRIAAVPKEWTQFYSLVSPPGFQSRGTVFLHERRTPRGKRVLVAVDYMGASPFRDFTWVPNWYERTALATTEFHIRVFEPGNAIHMPRQVVDRTENVTVPMYPRTSFGPAGQIALKLNVGQPDPADRTHFTVSFQIWETSGVIDGWVREDGVDLERREAPAIPPPPASPG